jgi:putative ABC transport system ATP-binding protein
VIRLDRVTRTYGSGTSLVTALGGVDLTIERGEYVAIMGTSGSGKSTMMNIIGCLDRPSDGDYLFEGVEVGRLPDHDRARLRGRVFGFVFQSYNLLPRLTALEQVELPLVYQRTTNRRLRAAEALVRVGLRDRIHHRPSQLSGGEQQRVAIARSLVVNPRLVLADEPTGALDTRTGEEVMQLLTQLVEEQGITVILVTHEAEIAEHAHRVIRMRDGGIVEDTTKRPRIVRPAPAADPAPPREAASSTGAEIPAAVRGLQA